MHTTFTAPIEAEPPFDGVLVVTEGVITTDPAVREWMQALAQPVKTGVVADIMASR